MIKLFNPIQSDDHKAGSDKPSVTLLEYGDFECPDCAEAKPMVIELLRRFPSLQFVFRHYPLKVHTFAQRAAELSEAATNESIFWQTYEHLFDNQSLLSEDFILEFLESKGISRVDALERANSQAVKDKVASQLKSGTRSGVSGTPRFFINEVKYEGKNTLEELSRAIEAHL